MCIKFYFKLSKMATETHKILREAFGGRSHSFVADAMHICITEEIVRIPVIFLPL
jgi:acetate kinase